MAYSSAEVEDYTKKTEDFKSTFQKELEDYYGEGKVTVDDGEDEETYDVTIEDEGTYTVDKKTETVTEKNESENTVPENLPEGWIVAKKSNANNDWYEYMRIKGDGSDTGISTKVNAPILKGKMKAVKYSKELSEISGVGDYTSRWANAMTTDGSMWVWIPRYAYRISSGYHEKSVGTVDIVFIDENNKPLGLSSEGNKVEPADITENLEEAKVQDGQNKYIVHPAFTDDVENGGGFGKAGKGITGFWFAKFEASEEAIENSGNDSESRMVSKPGCNSTCKKKMEELYNIVRKQKYGENEIVDSCFGESHIVKNSEWGAVAYLSISGFGTNRESMEYNESIEYTGNSSEEVTVYEKNYKESTTFNPYGIYDMCGGRYEIVASFVYEKQEGLESSKYWTLYECENKSDYRSEVYSKCEDRYGDAIYATSSSTENQKSWLKGDSSMPVYGYFFSRGGGNKVWNYPSIFSFKSASEIGESLKATRIALVF